MATIRAIDGALIRQMTGALLATADGADPCECCGCEACAGGTVPYAWELAFSGGNPTGFCDYGTMILRFAESGVDRFGRTYCTWVSCESGMIEIDGVCECWFHGLFARAALTIWKGPAHAPGTVTYQVNVFYLSDLADPIAGDTNDAYGGVDDDDCSIPHTLSNNNSHDRGARVRLGDEVTVTPLTTYHAPFSECTDPECDEPEPPCEPIEAPPYGVVILEGEIGGTPFRLCMGLTEDIEGAAWVGTLVAADSGCADDLTFTLKCFVEGDIGSWVLEVTDGTTTVVLPVTVTTAIPLAATVAGDLTGICGDAALEGEFSPCSGAIAEYPCCDDDLDVFEKCCIEIPDLYSWHVWDFGDGSDCASGGGQLEYIATGIYDPMAGKWTGTETWTLSGCCPGFPGIMVRSGAFEVECGYSYTGTGHSGVMSDAAPCPILDFIQFSGLETLGLCDGTATTVAIKFHTQPLLTPDV